MANINSPKIEKVAARAHETVDNVAQAADTLEKKAVETSQQVKQAAVQQAETVKTASNNAQEQVTAYVNENPLKSIGIAFGAGIVAAALLRK